jgi:hypothetical protein
VGEHGEYATVVLGRFLDPKLCECAPDVGLDGLRAEPECSADALVRAALCHQSYYLPLTPRKLGHGINPTAPGEQFVDYRSVDDALTGGDPLHGVRETNGHVPLRIAAEADG